MDRECEWREAWEEKSTYPRNPSGLPSIPQSLVYVHLIGLIHVLLHIRVLVRVLPSSLLVRATLLT
jgi:hypothetical protein